MAPISPFSGISCQPQRLPRWLRAWPGALSQPLCWEGYARFTDEGLRGLRLRDVVLLQFTPASSRDAGLAPSEISAAPGGLSAVTAPGTHREFSDDGKEAEVGQGPPGDLCSLPAHQCHCPRWAGASQWPLLGRRSAGPVHCLAGSHQAEQEGREPGNSLPSACHSESA